MGGTYMKILVLGSEGVIGSSLCKYLESCGHEIIRWDIKLTNDHDFPPFQYSVINSLIILKTKCRCMYNEVVLRYHGMQ